MLAAQRLPLEFDGVVAGNASFNLTRVAMNQVWSLQTVTGVPEIETKPCEAHILIHFCSPIAGVGVHGEERANICHTYVTNLLTMLERLL